MREKTKIWIYSKTPFRSDYDNVIHFKNKAEMDSFFITENKFMTLIHHSDSVQELGRNGEIVVRGRVENFENATYMRFINNGRTMYAFIYDIIYENENATSLVYEIDVWNTYQQELFKNRVTGQIEQMTRKNSVRHFSNMVQGFQSGTKTALKAGKVGVEVEWLVIVTKPTIKLNEKEGKKGFDQSFSGIQKQFRYYVLPVIASGSIQSLPFNIDGKDYKGTNLKKLFQELSGNGTSQTSEKSIVNNIVNIYLSRQIGVDYEYANGKVTITSKIPTYNVVEFGEWVTFTEIVNLPNTSGSSGNTIETNVTATSDGDISTEEKRVRLFTRIVKKMLPSATPEGIAGLIGNFSQESRVTAGRFEADNFTNSSLDKARQEPTAENLFGSWGAFKALYSIGLHEPTYLVNGKHYIGIGLGQWTGQRSLALFNFAKKNNLDVFSFDAQIRYLLTENRYKDIAVRVLSSKKPVADNVVDFLLNWEGIDYARAERIANGQQWYNVIKDEFSKTTTNQPEIRHNPAPKRQSDKVNQNMQKLRGKLGQFVGVAYGGQYQCYGIVSQYVAWYLGQGIGHNFGFIERTGQGFYAAYIGDDYNWSKYGWKVIKKPNAQTLKNYVGAVVNLIPNSTNPVLYTGVAGHTAIISEVTDTTIKVIEQNAPEWSPVEEHTYNLAQYVNVIRDIVVPAEIVGGASVDTSTNTISTGGTSYVTSKNFESSGSLIHIQDLFNFTPKDFEIPNLLKIAYDNITKQLKKYSGNDELEIECQLLSSEFTDIELYDIYGNNYHYQPQFLPRTLNTDRKYKVILTGTLGDNNQVHCNLLEYNNLNNNELINLDIFAIYKQDKKLFAISNPEHFKYGFNDMTGKSLTILNDSLASHIQANKNQMEATQLTFKENRDMLAKSIDLNNKNVALANEQSTYNSKYALDSAKINSVASIFDSAGSVIGNLMSGNIGGAISSGISGGFNAFNSGRNLGNMQIQSDFTQRNNMLRSQSNALSNMQAKLSLNQSIRGYNASLADLQNQPVSIQQIGADLSWQTGNNLTDIFWKIATAQNDILLRANNYFKMFGVIMNLYSDNALNLATQRQRFNYLKMTTCDILNVNANQSHLIALQAIFQSGVRIWKYANVKDDDFMFDISKNNPNRED